MKRNSGRASTCAVGIAVALGALLACVAPADLLVLHGGGEIETAGPWRIDGRQVLFETPAGRYSSIRTREVDLEASRERTRRAMTEGRSAPAEERKAKAEKPEPKWVLTDDDIAQVPVRRERQAPEQVVGDGDFDVLSLTKEPDASGFHLVVRGTLVNSGSEFKSDLVVQVRLVDPQTGGPIASTRASLQADDLPPGSATRFTARFANATPDIGMVQIEANEASDAPFSG